MVLKTRQKTKCRQINCQTMMDNTALKPVHTTEKLGTHPTRKASGPHLFVRVNYAYHVLKMGTDPLFFGGGGWGYRRLWLQSNKRQDQLLDSSVSLCNDFTYRMHSTVVSH